MGMVILVNIEIISIFLYVIPVPIEREYVRVADRLFAHKKAASEKQMLQIGTLV